MHIIIERTFIFHALQNVLGFVGGIKQSSPVLGHILLQVRHDSLFIIGTDLETEVIVHIPIYKIYNVGEITIPAKKFFDICRTLSKDSKITLKHQDNKLFVFSEERVRFSLVTFSPLDFPNMGIWDSEVKFIIPSDILKNLIELTSFAMGKRDVRYYLNGMLFEFNMQSFSAVATDGHRLAYCIIPATRNRINIGSSCTIIVPRKYIINMIRMLGMKERSVELNIGKQNISMVVGDYVISSKLINGVFPNYKAVISFDERSTYVLEIFSKKLQEAIKRAIILCNEQFHVVRFVLSLNQMKIVSSNSEHEQSEQVLDVVYSGKDMEVGFNVYYILDILNVIRSDKIRFLLTDEHSSVRIVSSPMDINNYIVMPIRL